MGWTGFTSLARANIDLSLKNDLQALDRYLRTIEDQLALLNEAEPLGSAQTQQNRSSIAKHASTHGGGGTDSIESFDFTLTGTLNLSGTTITPDFQFNEDVGDIYIHEKLTPVDTTGVWSWAGVGTFNAGAVVNVELGLGTPTVPHAGVGLASVVFAVDGADGGANGPHWQVTTALDDHPIAQYFHGAHDNVGIAFDAYYDGDPGGKWRMGDTTAFTVYKNSDWLRFTYATGTVGTEVVQNIAMAIDGVGVVYKGVPTAGDLMLHEDITSAILTGSWDFSAATITYDHASTHANGGGDSIEGLNFTWTGTQIFNSIIDHTTNDAFAFESDRGVGSAPAFTFKATNVLSPTYHTDWIDKNGLTILRLNALGQLFKNAQAVDEYLHEKSTTPIVTGDWLIQGDWDFSGITDIDGALNTSGAVTASAGAWNLSNVSSFSLPSGALAIASLANAAPGFIITYDTSFLVKLLATGATDQVLTAHGTGTEVTWEDAQGVSPLTTKGDIFSYSSVDARLAIGANNTVLMADSAQTTGNKWFDLFGTKNTWIEQIFDATVTTLAAEESVYSWDTVGAVTAGDDRYLLKYSRNGTKFLTLDTDENNLHFPAGGGIFTGGVSKSGMLNNGSILNRTFSGVLAAGKTGTAIQAAIRPDLTSSTVSLTGVTCTSSWDDVGTYVTTASQIRGGHFLASMKKDNNTATAGTLIGGQFQANCTETNINSPNVTTMVAGKCTLAFSGTNYTITNARFIDISQPGAPGSGTTITAVEGIRINNLVGYGTTNSAIVISSQSGASATKGNIRFVGGDWNTGHHQIGTGHLWATSGDLRFKDGAPTSATDFDFEITSVDITANQNTFISNGFGLIIGHTAQIDFGAIPEFQVLGTSTSDSSMGFARFENNASGPDVRFLKSRGGTIGTNTIVQDGDKLGRFRFQGADGGDFNTTAAEVSAEVDGAPALNDIPGRLIFTTRTAAGSLSEKMRLDNAGNLGIGKTAPDAKLHVDQTSTTAAIPVLTLDQADISEEMIEFITTIGTGNAIEAVGAKTLTVTHFIKVTLPGGLTRYLEVGTIA